MSVDHSLLCLDCGVALFIGQMYHTLMNGNELSEIEFSGHYDFRRHGANAYELFHRTLMAFLFLHRNHELRFISERSEYQIERWTGKSVEDVDDIHQLPSAALAAAKAWDPDEDQKYWERWWEQQRANQGNHDA